MSAKVKTIKKTLKDNDLVAMFNEMLGGQGDPEIISEKLVKIRGFIKRVVLVTQTLAAGPFRRDFPEYKEWLDDFQNFSNATAMLLDLDYPTLKAHNQIKHLIMVCQELVNHKSLLDDQQVEGEKFKDRWITNYPGMRYEIFSFTRFDIKHVWANDRMNFAMRRFILNTISILHGQCMNIHKVITSPDIDVTKFSTVIIESIEKLKGIPELNRCKDAFNKIRDSVSLLETNFGDYYKDMVQSENPNMLIENFIFDVSKGPNMNLNLMRQFRLILNFYKKQSTGHGSDPKMKKLFDSLNNSMSDMESKAAKIKNGEVAAL